MASWLQANVGDVQGNTVTVRDEAEQQPTKSTERTLRETYQPEGGTVYEYISEYHAISVNTRGNVHKSATAAMLRKLAGWIDQSPPPNGEPPLPWAASETPF
jgi:hypothetical protein